MKASKIFKITMLAAIFTLALLSTGLSQRGESAVPERADIEDQYKWRLQDIYPIDQLWEKDFKRGEGMLPKFKDFQGKLGKSAQSLLDCIVMRDTLSSLLDRLFVYARMRRDEDSRISAYQEMADRAGSLQTKAGQATAFIEPEISALPRVTITKFLKSNSRLGVYRHYFDDLERQRAHILPKPEEELLALAGDLARGPENLFELLSTADIKYGTIKDEKGKKVEISYSRYQKFLESSNRRVRKDASEAYHGGFGHFYNTLGANMGTNVNKDIFFAKARKYNSSLEASVGANNIPVSVYHNLITTVSEHLEPLHRYAALRKKVLKLKDLHLYDTYVPMVAEAKMDIPYEEAQEILVSGLAPLGETYISDMKSGWESGWVDVFETKSKASGAYSWGAYTTHPYVLLNYNNTLEDMFTIAHEMGHALNSLYTNKKQPYTYHDYATFVAEVASITNEMLLMRELLKITPDPTKKAYLLNYFIDQIRGTFYQQVLYGEFELAIHDRVEGGEALSAEWMSGKWKELLQKYWGPELVVDSFVTLSWGRIPHFYYNFYVYQYATGQAAGVALSEAISAGDPQAQKRYLDFLASGSSDYPIELLKKAGVDMSKPEPILAVLKLFDDLVTQLDELLDKR